MENSYTNTEKKIASYILNNASEIPNYSSFELAKKIGVSQSTIIKFISKTGFEGFTDFKILLSNETLKESKSSLLKHGDISLEDSLEDVSQAIVSESLSALSKTFESINFENIKMSINRIDKANRIFIFGKGSSSLPAFDLASKLMKVGLTAIWYQDLDSIKAASLNSNKNDVFIAFTFSGTTDEIVSILESARNNNSYVISVTKNANSSVGKLSNINLEITSNETLFRTSAMSSRIAFFSMVDILFLGIIKEDLSNRLDKVRDVYETTVIKRKEL